MRKTKIICTLGPATDSDEVLREMMLSGMNVARFNFSHGTHEEQLERINRVKRLRDELKLPIGILLDTRGPEVRIKTFKDGKIELEAGQEFTLTTREIEGDSSIVSITYEGLPSDVVAGSRILIDDGLIAMNVKEILNGTDIVCVVENSGPLSNRKSINVPGIELNMPYISEKDREDILFGIEQGIDFIAASFARNADDMKQLKAILKEKKATKSIGIMAKIENTEGVKNIDKILKEVDGIMVARGDLGVEVPFQELPGIQKMLIKKCIAAGKRSITATQMLESMTKNPRPTRAEVSDVANSVFDGTSAIMLSGETSVGKYPVETLRAMSSIAENAEKEIHYDRRRISRPEFEELNLAGDAVSNAISHATVTTSADVSAKVIVAFTESGHTARAVSSFRPGMPVVAATPIEKTFHLLSMSWGVIPVMARRPTSGTMLYAESIKAALSTGLVAEGDIVTVTAGMPVGVVKSTNTLRAHLVTADDVAEYSK